MKKYFISLAFCALSVAGCSQSVPKCSDEETTDLVKLIANEEMINQLGAASAKLFSYSLSAIRTTSSNEQTGAHECAAQLEFTMSETDTTQTNEIPITYTVEMTDKGDEFYVTVFGL